MLIPGPRAPTSDNIDVFLKPLVSDLLHLWHGVPAVNMSKPVNERAFTLKAILMWTVSDFSALELSAGHVVKGYLACPVCGSKTDAEHSRNCSKMIYLNARRFLPLNHRFRRARSAFNGEGEYRTAPQRRSGTQLLQEGRERAEYLWNGGSRMPRVIRSNDMALRELASSTPSLTGRYTTHLLSLLIFDISPY